MNWLSKRGSSLKYAFDGIAYLFKRQPNFWIHTIAALAVIILGFVFKISGTEWCLVIFAIGFVIAAEAFNTAIEVLIDLVSPKYNEKAKIVKDVAAAAVLVAAITSVVIGVIVFWERLNFNMF
jgi:diacylglycerol kinase